MQPILASLVMLFTASGASVMKDTPAGAWKGDILTPQGNIAVVVYLHETDRDAWGGSIDTPSQHSFGLPLSSVQVDSGHVIAECAATGGIWDATLAESGDALHGRWKQRGSEFPLNCTRIPEKPPVPATLLSDLVGTWEGPLNIGAVQLRLVLTLQKSSPTTLGGFMVSPDQSPDEIPLGRVDWVSDRSIRVLIGSLGATFDIALSPENDVLAGKFAQGGGAFDIELHRVEKQTVINRPQEPKPPFPYSAEEVSYRNDDGDVTLAGTLTIPQGDGPFPAAVMITGSGGQDRNEEIFRHKPFWVIADHLTRRGIAVLRVDDRGIGGSSAGPNPGEATSHDFAGDVEAGVAFLANRPEIDTTAIGLIGHSEGGVIAPIVASRNSNVAFIVLMAGTGVRGDALLIAQTTALMRAGGSTEDEISAATATNRALFAVLADESLSADVAEQQIRAIIEADPEFAMASAEEQAAGIQQALSLLNTPWMKAFAKHDPAITLKEVSCPVLAINGQLDLQVPHEQNLPTIAAALKSGGNTDVTIHAFPNLNHLFQHSETGLVSEYGQIEETISPDVLDLLSQWITERFQGMTVE
ncbi:MAG: alpha/beta fold hydrolase [Planctomycetes bacterium]|nr:alpha/beta fold hydrolase [Planctomycetota bacterium]